VCRLLPSHIYCNMRTCQRAGSTQKMRDGNLSASHKEIINKEAFEQLAAEAGLTDENHLSEQTARTPTTLELETEKIYQRARPLPMVRHWLTRCFAVAVVSLAMPYIADLLHPAGSSEEHGEETEAKDVRHAEGTHHDGSPVVDMQWSLLLLLVLIGLALVCERLREVLEESLAKHAAVVERIWSELAVLGSLSLTSYVLVQGGVLGRVSLLAYGDEAHEVYLLRLFGAIHLSLLCGLASFLLCALLLLRASVVAERQWGSYEAFIACYTLGGTAAAAAPHDCRHDYGARLCRQELLQVVSPPLPCLPSPTPTHPPHHLTYRHSAWSRRRGACPAASTAAATAVTAGSCTSHASGPSSRGCASASSSCPPTRASRP
jgi:hypothetical protein